MIKVNFHTNLDDYFSSDFPQEVLSVPRVGEHINVLPELEEMFIHKKLPRRLKVVDVTHTVDREKKPIVKVELWYSDTEYKLFFPNGLENRR